MRRCWRSRRLWWPVCREYLMNTEKEEERKGKKPRGDHRQGFASVCTGARRSCCTKHICIRLCSSAAAPPARLPETLDLTALRPSLAILSSLLARCEISRLLRPQTSACSQLMVCEIGRRAVQGARVLGPLRIQERRTHLQQAPCERELPARGGARGPLLTARSARRAAHAAVPAFGRRPLAGVAGLAAAAAARRCVRTRAPVG